MTPNEHKMVMELMLEHDTMTARMFQHFLEIPAKPAVILKRAKDRDNARDLRDLLGPYQVQYSMLSSMLSVMYAPDIDSVRAAVTNVRKSIEDTATTTGELPDHKIARKYAVWCLEHPLPEEA